MNESQFKMFRRAAKTLDDDYNSGYRFGLRRHYYGEDFSAEQTSRIVQGFIDGINGRSPEGFYRGKGTDVEKS